jgi:hypothetical protein
VVEAGGDHRDVQPRDRQDVREAAHGEVVVHLGPEVRAVAHRQRPHQRLRRGLGYRLLGDGQEALAEAEGDSSERRWLAHRGDLPVDDGADGGDPLGAPPRLEPRRARVGVARGRGEPCPQPDAVASEQRQGLAGDARPEVHRLEALPLARRVVDREHQVEPVARADGGLVDQAFEQPLDFAGRSPADLRAKRRRAGPADQEPEKDEQRREARPEAGQDGGARSQAERQSEQDMAPPAREMSREGNTSSEENRRPHQGTPAQKGQDPAHAALPPLSCNPASRLGYVQCRPSMPRSGRILSGEGAVGQRVIDRSSKL